MLKKEDLIRAEDRMVELFEEGRVPYPLHLSGGNEDQLIEIFKEVKKDDYVFSHHRSHYHYLLAGGTLDKLEEKVLDGKSMLIFDKEINFLASSIVSGLMGTAVGVAYAMKRENVNSKVWVFIGDGAEDEGHFYEAIRYVDGHNLPCTFIIEDNDRSVDTPKIERYGTNEMKLPECVRRYHYVSKYPHVGTGKWVTAYEKLTDHKIEGDGVGF
jgi:TPP-dependent pyruvate/acetoin dehydrogenase alpha subunit